MLTPRPRGRLDKLEGVAGIELAIPILQTGPLATWVHAHVPPKGL